LYPESDYYKKRPPYRTVKKDIGLYPPQNGAFRALAAIARRSGVSGAGGGIPRQIQMPNWTRRGAARSLLAASLQFSRDSGGYLST